MTKAKLIVVTLAVALALPVLAGAQVTASGTLAVNATVQSSINLVFNSDGAGVGLTGSGTNAATMNLGNISAYGTLAAGVSRTVAAANFRVSSPFDVVVSQANGSSANYTLTAQLNAADATNGWDISGSAVTNAAATTLTNTGAYGSSVAYTLGLTVPLASPGGAIANQVNFVATAN